MILDDYIRVYYILNGGVCFYAILFIYFRIFSTGIYDGVIVAHVRVLVHVLRVVQYTTVLCYSVGLLVILVRVDYEKKIIARKLLGPSCHPKVNHIPVCGKFC